MDVVSQEDVTDDANVPEGYDSADAFLEEARKRFQEGVDADRENRDAGLDDLKFIAGEQWDPVIKAKRKNKPCLTINTLPQYVGQVIGDMRSNRPSIKVRPAEDGDKKIAEVRQGVIRFIENQSNATQVYSLAGEDQVSCGLGHFRVGLEWANDDAFDQDIRIRHVPNPFSVVWDAMSTDPTGRDARYCFVVDEMDRKAFEASYPDAAVSGLTVDLHENTWVSRDTVRVTEYWLIKETTRTIALMQPKEGGQPTIQDITGREEQAKPYILPGADGQPRMREVIGRSACMYLINGHEILAGPYEYPITRLPIFKVTGREVRVGDRRYRFGLIRFAKDSIRIKNLMRSAAMEWVAMAPKAKWLLHAADEAEANRYRRSGSSDDPVLSYSGQIPPQRIDPPSSPAALLQEAQFNDADIKDVTGLHDASLGMRSNETSGKAIMARERQGDVATMMYHDNLNLSIREAGRVINELIPVVFDTARTLVVLGEDEGSSPVRVNDPQAEEYIDLKMGKYDVVVETGPSYSTKRVEAAESMMAFVQAVPAAGQVAADLIAEAMDWPGAEAIARRLKAGLPPQLTQGESKDPPTPEQQQQMQAAQQQQQMQAQMQQQMHQLQMAEQQAKVEELRAKAALTMAQAQLAMQPADMGQDGETENPIDLEIKYQQARKARFDADKAMYEAMAARDGKPLEALHSLADLEVKLNPQPEMGEGEGYTGTAFDAD